MKKMIDYPLFHDPVEITNALVTVQRSRGLHGLSALTFVFRFGIETIGRG
jgi:hypothetical protein